MMVGCVGCYLPPTKVSEAERGRLWGWRRVFVVGGGCMEGGQEVAGMEVCVYDKWSDRCGKWVPQCLGGRTSEGLGLAESPFTLLRGKHEMKSPRGNAFNPFVLLVFAHHSFILTWWQRRVVAALCSTVMDNTVTCSSTGLHLCRSDTSRYQQILGTSSLKTGAVCERKRDTEQG